MDLHGHQLIGRETSRTKHDEFTAVDPRSSTPLPPSYCEASSAEINRALALAAAAHPAYEESGREKRAAFLEKIAAGLEALGPALLERASSETGLPLPRLESERGRTCGQLRLFAQVVREGRYLDLRIDHAQPERKPQAKPDVRSMQRALGPVVVFGASNFPLAFSVAGGDTAAALAAGCPVVVKAHPNHPGTSEMAGRVIVEAAQALGLPAGTFALLHGRSVRVGAELVQHPLARAVAFTGSLRGGRALYDLAAARPVPIPVFAEMGSINPSFVLEGRLRESPAELAQAFAHSITLGVGQFCTNPGLVIVPKGETGDRFLHAFQAALAAKPEAPMLHAGIQASYRARLAELSAVPGVEILYSGQASAACHARAALLCTTAATFLAQPQLHEEVFGPASLAVRAPSQEDLLALAHALQGQLTATLHAAPTDYVLAGHLSRILGQKVGRLLFNSFPTGVEVCHAMVHGGPYPATTDSRTTSVGPAALTRFTRPLCYQDFPKELLPLELQESSTGLVRLADGELSLPTAAN